MSPPLRDAEEHDALWSGLAGGTISTIGTDHAPFNFRGQKEMGSEAFTQIPNGIPSIQERVDLVHTHGVVPGKIDLRTFVDTCSTGAAKAFKMFPRKGALAVGSDADVVLYDPAFIGTFTHKDGLSKVDYCGFEGMPRRGRAELVFLRGQLAARAGVFVGQEAAGQYIRR